MFLIFFELGYSTIQCHLHRKSHFLQGVSAREPKSAQGWLRTETYEVDSVIAPQILRKNTESRPGFLSSGSSIVENRGRTDTDIVWLSRGRLRKSEESQILWWWCRRRLKLNCDSDFLARSLGINGIPWVTIPSLVYDLYQTRGS